MADFALFRAKSIVFKKMLFQMLVKILKWAFWSIHLEHKMHVNVFAVFWSDRINSFIARNHLHTCKLLDRTQIINADEIESKKAVEVP